MSNLSGIDSIHVLVVDHDRVRLAKNCGWLIGEGWNVTARSSGDELVATVRKLRPDVVLVDVNMPELGTSDWRNFLDECASGDPVVIAHTQLSPKAMRTVVECRFILRVLRPTDDKDEFLQHFETLVSLARAKRPRRMMSGTHRIDLPESDAEEPAPHAQGRRNLS
jgi:CheY-like chemotaxis protein